MSRKVQQIWPKFVQTVGAMRDHNVRVKAACNRCGNSFKVDLAALCTLHGRSYSLINKRGQCRLVDCDGSCVFLFSPGHGTPFLPLAD